LSKKLVIFGQIPYTPAKLSVLIKLCTKYSTYLEWNEGQQRRRE